MRVAVGGYLALCFLGRILQVEPDDVRPRCHEGVHGAVVQAEHALDHFLLGGFEHPFLGPLFDHQLDFFLGDGGLRGRLDAAKPQHQLSGKTEQLDQGRGHPGQAPHGGRKRRGNALGMLQADLLGDQLADDQGQERDGQDDDEQTDGASARCDPGNAIELGSQFIRNRRPAIGAGENADQRDADLNRG